MTVKRRLRILSAPIIIACALAVASAPASAAVRAHSAADATCPDTTLAPDVNNLPSVAASVLCLVNTERARVALPALSLNLQLTQASQPMADRMVREQFFSHDTPDGRTLLERIQPTGYLPNSGDWVVGENLAWGNGPLATPDAIVAAWMNSPGHRANILAADYRDIGIGLAVGSPLANKPGGTTYVTDFGQRAPTPRRSRVAISHRVVTSAKRVIKRASATRVPAFLTRSGASRRAAVRRALLRRLR
jgi:uncharacterized protein YkwD